MDSIVNSAMEEICAVGATGLTLPNLWPKLQSSFISNGLAPCINVKKALWTNLLNVPGLQFESRGVCYNNQDSVIQSVEDCEKLNLKIVAAEHLRNCFVGLYDIKASNTGISVQGRRALERIAIARTNGITQSELGKEFGLPGNKIFYVLRKLECQGLIVRQSTILRKTEVSSDRGQTNSSIVSTNMIHLYRFAKHLGCQQRLEVIKEDKLTVNEDEETAPHASGMVEESVIEQVKDFLPELKRICDKLEKADNNVLIVSDLKKDLGYCGTSGHRRWRNILHRLKDARVVEEFTAKVNTKEVSCLKLLKKFSPKHFEPKSLKFGLDDLDVEEPVILGKRGQINDQLVELPLEHQVYDIIDAEGSKGLSKTELCKRLGLNNKRYNTRLQNLFSRFGMHLQAESHNRGVAYRVWSHRNFNPEASSTYTDKPDIVHNDNETSVPDPGKRIDECSTELEDDLTNKEDAIITGEIKSVSTELEIFKGLPAVGDSNMLLGPSSSENLSPELSRITPVAELHLVNKTPISEATTESHVSSTPQKRRSHPKYLCLTMNALSRQREHRILELLQEEKFMIKAELHRHLEGLDKDKQTTMDRKTLERSLNKLQQEGLCKLIHVGVPAVTNCGRSRTMDIVLHHSLDNISPELLSQIYERVRSFEMQIRNHQSSAKLKKSKEAPILDGVQRILTNAKDDQSERIEAMRENGYVPAKMVRAKLLHVFLWRYLTKLPGWNDALLSGMHGYDRKNPHSTCKMIELDTAIKAMPLELFLQVVGSTMKFEDMTQKCRTGTCLSDLSVQEYEHLMGNQATARLSNLVQILRGLKLIRMVRSENFGDGDAAAVLDTTLTYSLELKPYIEEPVSLTPSSSAFVSFDIRPQYRHDFVLSSGKAVDEYWNTLEYCYAAVDRKAALHAFPGSAVHEVYLARSWASARVMTADQRTELNRCIMKNGPDKKLSLSACEKIAKDLSLTLEQVLRVYYDNRQKRNTRLKEVLKQEESQPLNRKCASSSQKRQRSSRKRPSEHAKVDSVESVLPIMSSDTGDKFIDGHDDLETSTAEQENNMSNDQADENMKSIEELEVQEKDDADHSFISECALSRLKPIHRKKFSWTENADRQLVMEYARERAALGANFHRIDWNALPNLPASPAVCKRRMAILNSSIQFRKAVLKLCNILTERYAKHLNELQNKSVLDGECRVMVRNIASAGYNSGKNSDGLQQSQEINPEDQWDDFNNKDVKMAFDEALRHKRTAKLDVHREIHSVSDEFSHAREDGEQSDPKLLSSAISNKRKRKRAMRSNVSGRLQKKYVKFLNGGADVNRRAFRSLAISNAVELFKLVFLNASTAPEVPTLLAETLRRYSEHDLFAAFNYLRDAKIMVGGSGASPFVLSQKFIHGISSSPYPTNTGKIAAEFRRWLHGKEKYLMEEGIDIPANIQCGDVVYLSALLSSREILILPCLPDQGVGEAEDLRAPKRRRENEFNCADKAKKSKAATIGEGEICSRREKGFPGIKLSLTRATISRIDIIDLFKERDVHSDEFLCGRNEQKASSHVGSTKTDHIKEILDLGTAVSLKISADDTPWEAMTCYADNLNYIADNQVRESPFCPQIFKTVYSAIQKAGDQGLSMEEISKVTNIQGDKVPEIIIEVLEAFGRALKVNAYDSVHVVDSLYRSKYCLTSLGDPRQYRKEDPSTDSSLIVDKQPLVLHPDNHENDFANVPSTSIIDDDEHRVTILNLPEDIQPSSEVQRETETETESCQQLSIFPEKHQVNDIDKFLNGSSYLCRPILSWMNGDGTINEVVYKGLIRRVLGILMQSPGMLEADIIRRMHVLNPQSCRKLLELMMLDNAIIVRKMHQATSCEPPALLGGLIKSSFKKPKSVFREHFFANPVSAATLL